MGTLETKVWRQEGPGDTDRKSPTVNSAKSPRATGVVMPRLYEYAPSGNCYKVRLAAHQLQFPLERVHIPLETGAARTPEFRAQFPLGRVPVLELGGGEQLAESNAILFYLAEGSSLFPTERLARARCVQWMFFEQYSHEPYIAVARAWLKYFGVPPGKHAELAERQTKGYAALDVMERHLATARWFSGTGYGIADIALFAYTHVAHEGDFNLGGYPGIRAWIEQVRNTPRFVPIDV